MKVALVHDYLNEFGGAERVLQALSDMYPEAPIYTAFYVEGSPAFQRLAHRQIRPSWAQKVPGFATKLHSPLRFLAPMIWESFDLDEFDVVISSSSWYITKGVLTQPETLHICYCHTPPRYLYGYDTAMDWRRSWLARRYADWVNPGMREYDLVTAARVDEFVTNSENTRRRIQKFYRRDARVIYPPASLSDTVTQRHSGKATNHKPQAKGEYLLTGGRLVRAKHFDVVIQAANKLRLPLKVFGAGPLRSELESMAGGTVEFVGKVNEAELADLYTGAMTFVALATDEDFGITPVEAQMAGIPVIAYRGGGFLESVVEGKTGLFVDDLELESLVEAIQKLQAALRPIRQAHSKQAQDKASYKPQVIKRHARKFSRERFEREMRRFVDAKWKEHRVKMRM